MIESSSEAGTGTMDPQPSMPSSSPTSPLSSSSSPPEGARKGAAASPPPSNFFGKHRMAASLSQLHHQIDIVKKELEQLETLGESSIACRELFSSVESVPDPLLPETAGSINMNWERWFGGTHEAKSHKKWIQNHRLTSLFPSGS